MLHRILIRQRKSILKDGVIGNSRSDMSTMVINHVHVPQRNQPMRTSVDSAHQVKSVRTQRLHSRASRGIKAKSDEASAFKVGNVPHGKAFIRQYSTAYSIRACVDAARAPLSRTRSTPCSLIKSPRTAHAHWNQGGTATRSVRCHPAPQLILITRRRRLSCAFLLRRYG